MDHENLQAIETKLPYINEKYRDKAAWLKSKIESFIITKDPAEFYFYNDKDEFIALIELLSLDGDISASQIDFIRIYGTYDYDTRLDKNPDFDGTVMIKSLLAKLPDLRDIFVENANDFIVSVGVRIDESSLLVATWQQEEYYLVCDTCEDNGYPCQHKDDDGYSYESKYWAILLDPKDANKINWDDGIVMD